MNIRCNCCFRMADACPCYQSETSPGFVGRQASRRQAWEVRRRAERHGYYNCLVCQKLVPVKKRRGRQPRICSPECRLSLRMAQQAARRAGTRALSRQPSIIPRRPLNGSRFEPGLGEVVHYPEGSGSRWVVTAVPDRSKDLSALEGQFGPGALLVVRGLDNGDFKAVASIDLGPSQ